MFFSLYYFSSESFYWETFHQPCGETTRLSVTLQFCVYSLTRSLARTLSHSPFILLGFVCCVGNASEEDLLWRRQRLPPYLASTSSSSSSSSSERSLEKTHRREDRDEHWHHDHIGNLDPLFVSRVTLKRCDNVGLCNAAPWLRKPLLMKIRLDELFAPRISESHCSSSRRSSIKSYTAHQHS